MSSRGGVALALALCAARAAPADLAPPVPIRYDLAVDGAVAGGAIAASLLLAGFETQLTPAACRWCVPGPVDASLHGATLWADPQAADVTSGVLEIAVIPVSMLGYLVLSANAAGDVSAGLVDALLVVEAVAISQVLTQAVKEIAARQRPWAYYGPNPGGEGPVANLSFYSAHTSFTFATVAATLTVASLRGYPGAWIAGASGFVVAAFVGYLRMAADAHYFTDVLVGAAAGGLVGFAVPYLFHGRKKATEPGAIVPAPGGLAVTFW
ncbi:MAG TPA: phosphatase PAP2 family protein [Anaeromyxobacteraceae bacterium]|nr:phosphatase PAP2 family protein [Anaeromyxobacteraceae bacterium]